MGYPHNVFNECLLRMKKIKCHIIYFVHCLLFINHSSEGLFLLEAMLCYSCHRVRAYELWLCEGTTCSFGRWWPCNRTYWNWKGLFFRGVVRVHTCSPLFISKWYLINSMLLFILNDFFVHTIQFYSHK